MTDPNDKQRDRKIAENEQQQQVKGDIRVSTAAIAGAVIVALAVFGWLLVGR